MIFISTNLRVLIIRSGTYIVYRSMNCYSLKKGKHRGKKGLNCEALNLERVTYIHSWRGIKAWTAHSSCCPRGTLLRSQQVVLINKNNHNKVHGTPYRSPTQARWSWISFQTWRSSRSHETFYTLYTLMPVTQ